MRLRLPSEEGFFAVAYRDKETGHIVVASSGTKSLNEIPGDISIGLKQIPSEHKYAIQFHEYIVEKYVKSSSEKIEIIHVGHSKRGRACPIDRGLL